MQIKPNYPNFDSGPNIGGWSACISKKKGLLFHYIYPKIPFKKKYRANYGKINTMELA